MHYLKAKLVSVAEDHHIISFLSSQHAQCTATVQKVTENVLLIHCVGELLLVATAKLTDNISHENDFLVAAS